MRFITHRTQLDGYVNTVIHNNLEEMVKYVSEVVTVGVGGTKLLTIEPKPVTVTDAVKEIAEFIKSDDYEDESYTETFERIQTIMESVTSTY